MIARFPCLCGQPLGSPAVHVVDVDQNNELFVWCSRCGGRFPGARTSRGDAPGWQAPSGPQVDPRALAAGLRAETHAYAVAEIVRALHAIAVCTHERSAAEGEELGGRRAAERWCVQCGAFMIEGTWARTAAARELAKILAALDAQEATAAAARAN
jgi:hypothetical protein